MLNQDHGIPTLTPRHEANLETKKRFVEAIFAGDWATFEQLCHPEFELHEPSALPYGGVYKGVDGFQTFWKTPKGHVTNHLETLGVYFTENPDEIIAELGMRGSLPGSEAQFPCSLMEKFAFADGKVRKLTVYFFDVPHLAAKQHGAS
jgi:hypothetical protein